MKNMVQKNLESILIKFKKYRKYIYNVCEMIIIGKDDPNGIGDYKKFLGEFEKNKKQKTEIETSMLDVSKHIKDDSESFEKFSKMFNENMDILNKFYNDAAKIKNQLMKLELETQNVEKFVEDFSKYHDEHTCKKHDTQEMERLIPSIIKDLK